MTGITEVIQAPIFARQRRKLHKQQIHDLDNAVKSILSDPAIGDMKAGDLQGVRAYKYQSNKQQALLAYEIAGSALYLYAFGSHENFYRYLKRYR